MKNELCPLNYSQLDDSIAELATVTRWENDLKIDSLGEIPDDLIDAVINSTNQ